MTDDTALRGRLLVATPRLREPTFHRTVILLLDHGPDGAIGVVLNRPSTVDVGVVLPDWQEHVVDGIIVGAVEPGAPPLQPLDQALAGGLVTTAAFPIHQLS